MERESILESKEVQLSEDSTGRSQGSARKSNPEVRKLRQQLSGTKRENEILRQIKDLLTKKLQNEEKKNLQLSLDAQQKRTDSPNRKILEFQNEIRELRTKVAIAEAEREAAQTFSDVHKKIEKSFYLTPDEKIELHFKWITLLWYWSLASKLSVCPDIAPIHAEYWSKKMKKSPLVDVERLTLGSVAELLQCRPRNDDSEDTDEADESVLDHPEERYTLHDLLHAETSLRMMYQVGLDSQVNSALMERVKPQVLPSIKHLSGAEGEEDLALRKLDTIPLDLAQANIAASAYDFVAGIQLSRLWLTYIWGKAAEQNIEPRIALIRRDYWRERSSGKLDSLDILDTQEGIQELGSLQVENQILMLRSKWHDRRDSTGSEIR